MALLGDNGAGKTTTLRMLTGLLPPDSGSATMLGQDCWSAAVTLRDKVAYVPEKPRYYDWMTVAELGWFAAGFHAAPFLGRFEQWCQRLDLDLKARLKNLSKGHYAKVGLALALAADPQVLLLDEPTSGLDLLVRRDFLGSMVELAARTHRRHLQPPDRRSRACRQPRRVPVPWSAAADRPARRGAPPYCSPATEL